MSAGPRLVVLNVVGMTPGLLRHAPNLAALADAGEMRPLDTITPAVTCSVQATLLTGTLPREHGIVGNGWYFRDLAEVLFWRQSNHLVRGEMVWDAARRHDPASTCAQLFWWFNMYSTADVAVTPRPMYPADGRKLPDIYTEPAGLRDELNAALGEFPLFRFWGPGADISSTDWIAGCASYVLEREQPAITFVYLPHLDYDLQRLGPDDPAIAAQVTAVDAICGRLIADARRVGAEVVALSEYGITRVDRPIHINRALRREGLIRLREELGRELLDAGASPAFAVADHQIAHIYVRESERIAAVRDLIAGLPGVERVLDEAGKCAIGLDHPRSGELVAIAEPDAWFTYYHFDDPARAPDYARTVDIHRKPGYDPVELFVDPELRAPKVRMARRLAQKKLGFRYLMDVIGLDAGLVRGSHGRPTDDPAAGPLVISSRSGGLPPGGVAATEVKDLLLDHVFAGQPAP